MVAIDVAGVVGSGTTVVFCGCCNGISETGMLRGSALGCREIVEKEVKGGKVERLWIVRASLEMKVNMDEVGAINYLFIYLFMNFYTRDPVTRPL